MLQLSLDGLPLSDISAYRVQSPVFSFTLNTDNVISALMMMFGFPGSQLSGTYSPAHRMDTGGVHTPAPGPQQRFISKACIFSVGRTVKSSSPRCSSQGEIALGTLATSCFWPAYPTQVKQVRRVHRSSSELRACAFQRPGMHPERSSESALAILISIVDTRPIAMTPANLRRRCSFFCAHVPPLPGFSGSVSIQLIRLASFGIWSAEFGPRAYPEGPESAGIQTATDASDFRLERLPGSCRSDDSWNPAHEQPRPESLRPRRNRQGECALFKAV